MASVVFIIRVPYEESSKDMKPKLPEEGNENLEETKGEGGNAGSVNDQNVKEVKFDIDQKTDNPQDQNEAEIGDATNEADQTTDDVEMLTGPLNLAEVSTFIYGLNCIFNWKALSSPRSISQI